MPSCIHLCHERNPAPGLNGLKWLFFHLPSATFSKTNAISPFAIHLLIMLFTFASFGPCFPRFVFHQISAVVVASLSFAALLLHLVLRWKQRSYCSKIKSGLWFLPCGTSMDSCKVNLSFHQISCITIVVIFFRRICWWSDSKTRILAFPISLIVALFR